MNLIHQKLEVGVVVEGHVDRWPDGRWQACIHLPGDYAVQVEVAPSVATPEKALEVANKAVNQNLERLLKAAPASARRAYCLAIGGGFDQ